MSTNIKLLAVIVPTYNMSDRLPVALNSIINQSLKDIDIFIVDDCSTDNTQKVILKYKKENQNIKVKCFKKNMNLGYARQWGLDNIETKYVTFVDADDWVDSNAYMCCIQRMLKDKSDIAIYGIKNEYSNSTMSSIRYKYENNCVSGEFALELLTHSFSQDIAISPIVNNKVYSVQFLKHNNIKFSYLHYYEDIDFSFHVIKNAKKISLISNSFYHYFQNPKSKLHNIDAEQILCFSNAFATLYKKEKLCNGNMRTFFSYLDKSVTALVNRIDNFIMDSDLKKKLILLIFNEITKIIPMNEIIDYININRIINFFRIID